MEFSNFRVFFPIFEFSCVFKIFRIFEFSGETLPYSRNRHVTKKNATVFIYIYTVLLFIFRALSLSLACLVNVLVLVCCLGGL